MATELIFAPRSRKMIEDPHTFYHKLREVDPVHWSAHSNCWVLTRFDDVNRVLKDSRFGRGETYRITARNDAEMNPVEKLRSNLLPFKDGDAHNKIRSAMNAVFHKRVTKLEPQIIDLAEMLLAQVEGRETFDLIADYAYPLSIGVISILLGIPMEDKDIFKRFSPHFSALLVPQKTADDIALANKLIDELGSYFKALLDNNREGSDDNLLQMMLRANAENQKMSEDEMLVMPIFLIFAGHETSMNMIANGMYKLFKQPDQLTMMIEQPALITTAMEEIFRVTSTNTALYRIALEDVEVGDKIIKKGEELVAVLSAANRDPDRFTDPDKIDIMRDEGAHIAFGSGIHHCMGATMARMEGKIAFETLFKHFPNISLAQEPQWKESLVFRGLKSLIVNTGKQNNVS